MLNSISAAVKSGLITDIVIAVVMLIIIAVNLKKGFVRQVIGIIASIGALIVAIAFCKSLAGFVNDKFGWTDSFAAKIFSSFGDKEIFKLGLNEESIRQAVQTIGLPEFVANLAVKLAEGATDPDATVGAYLSLLFAKYIVTAGSFVALYIVARIVFGIIKHFIVKAVSLPIISQIDKILALVLGILKSLIILYVVIYIVDLLPSSGEFLTALKTAFSESVLVKFFSGLGITEFVLDKFASAFGSIGA